MTDIKAIVQLQRHGDVRDATAVPVHTVRAGGNHHAIVMRNNTARGDQGQMSTPVHEPVRTVTTAGHQSLVMANMANNVPRDPTVEPAPTVTTGERLAMVMPNDRTGSPRDAVSEPAATLTTKDRLALIVPAGGSWQNHATPTFDPAPTQTARESKAIAWTDEDIDDCRFRMFALHEIAGAMRLDHHPDGRAYVVTGNRREQMAQYGNAVTPPAMALIVGRLLEVTQAETFTDMFCGAGGSSLGAEFAGGRMRLGLNHWQRAIDTHSANFEHADHDCADVSLADPRRYPATDILLASPECFPTGTLITTFRGQVPIEEVRVGDLVLTHRARWRRVVRTQSSRADTIIVRGQGHTPGIEVTRNHPFWLRCSDQEWDNANRRYARRWDAPEWMKIGEAANVDAYWATPAPRTGGTPYPDIQPLMPPAAFGSVGAWWLIGRWLADGSLTFGSGRCDVSICCGFHEEDELAGRIDSTGQAWKYRALRTAALFHVTDREARDWLHEHFGHGARDKQLPGWVLALCRHDRQDLLNGYVSGDGSVGRRTRCDTVSHRLAVGVRLLAESLGHRVSLFRYEQHSRTIEGRELKNVAPVWAVTWETAGSSRETYQHPTDQQAWSRIRSIEDGRENVQVFNLEVEEDESYVAEGIVVHNCTNHSLAKGARRRKPQAASLFEDGPGGDAEQDKSRATMWDVVRFAEAMLTRGKPYKAIVVENVTDAFKWGANDDGGLFSSWLTAMDALGYEHEIVWLNSMLAHGEIMVPQSRDRMYPVFWLKGIRRPNLRFHPTSWCTRCEKVVAGVQTWKRPGGRVSGKYGQQYFYSCPDCHATAIPGAAPADAIIDWALPAQRIGDRKRPLAENTVKRIRRGLERLTSEPFAIRLLQSGAPRTLTLPLVTLTTRHDMAMVLPVAGNTFERTPGNRARDARLVPLDTVHGIADKAVVVPPMGSVTPRSTLAPAPTQTTTTRPALVQAP